MLTNADALEIKIKINFQDNFKRKTYTPLIFYYDLLFEITIYYRCFRISFFLKIDFYLEQHNKTFTKCNINTILRFFLKLNFQLHRHKRVSIIFVYIEHLNTKQNKKHIYNT